MLKKIAGEDGGPWTPGAVERTGNGAATGGPRAARGRGSTCAAPVDHLWPWALVARHRPAPTPRIPGTTALSLSCLSLSSQNLVSGHETSEQRPASAYTEYVRMHCSNLMTGFSTPHQRAGRWVFLGSNAQYVFETNAQFFHQI